METKSRNVAEEAAARTREIMEKAHTAASHELTDTEAPALLKEGEGFVRQHPGEAVLGAISLGFLLSRLLPVRALLGGLFSLGWMLAKPLALIYAGAKLYKWSNEKPSLPSKPIQGMSEK